MNHVRLTRTVRFSAAHRYYRPDWPAERNQQVFGPCAHEHGHGHRYTCQVTVSGQLNKETGMAMDLRDLDDVLRTEIFERFDHRHINHDVPDFAFGKQIPTTESLAVYIWDKVEPQLPACVTLIRVRVREDEDLIADYCGER